MRIFYTTKRIFWSNEGQDYLEDTQFNEFFSGQWIELSNVKSINWTSHYEASFYATDAFDATYFKVEKNNQTYYFFVQDIKNDSANGKFWYLTLDLYNTYGLTFVQTMQAYNPPVSFKRKHCNRYFRSNNPEKKFCFDFNRQRYLLTPPSTLTSLVKNLNIYPSSSRTITFDSIGRRSSWANYNNGYPEILHTTTNTKYYEYLILKIPGSYPTTNPSVIIGWKGSYPTDFIYVPLEVSYSEGNVSYPVYYGTMNYNPYDPSVKNFGVRGLHSSDFSRIPSDLIVGKVRTSTPPSAFLYFAFWKEVYSNTSHYLNDQIVFMRPLFFFAGPHTRYSFTSIRHTEQYTSYLDEPILSLPPFNRMTLNGGDELSPLCFFKKNDKRPGTYIDDNDNAWCFASSASFFVRPPKGALEHEYQVKRFIEGTYKKPVYGDVLSNYLLNNANAVSTGIQNKIGSALLGGIGGLINVGGSIVSSNVSGTLQGGVGIGQSAWGVAQTFRNHQARLADLGNKVDDLKDVYGKGATVEDDQCLVISKYELPEHIKELVFKDIYFNGYEFNGVDNFNSYRNREIFNYFEISDINQFLNLYTSYPKQIINDLSEKFLNGIRLWRTTAVNFDMSLDNREISFD